MGDEVSVTVRRERGVVIAEVAGDMDLSTVPGLRERLLEAAGGGEPLIVDLNRVSFIDSAGLGVLVGVARRAGNPIAARRPGRVGTTACYGAR
jgi:anti-anti-sigma factor